MRGTPVFLALAVCLVSCCAAAPTSTYILGDQGDSCTQACYKQGLNCNPNLALNGSNAIFQKLGVTCNMDSRPWWANNQPGYVSASNDGNFKDCLGWNDVPTAVLCAGAFPTVQRVCRCDSPDNTKQFFGTGLSNGAITGTEQFIFSHTLAPGTKDVGVMTHLWLTYPANVDKGVIVRYYIDGEKTASIEFEPSLACGVGFYDKQSPWGNKWFGKGANDGAWNFNFRIPFQKSIAISFFHVDPAATFGGFYMIVRGALNVPISVGDVQVPTTAKLNLFKINAQQFNPLQWVTLANIPSGQGTKGVFFMHTIAVSSGNLNFLEGCYHAYVNGEAFPGTLLSTGTEDYFDSAWYFNSGEFHLPVSGYTHYDTAAPGINWSAYRFHEMDPLQFSDGLQFVWRNGDAYDASGIKCLIDQGGKPAGSPTVSTVTTYAWVYTW
eukprot:TRINITY_DN488_c0_g1_i1.p1 TRINITY_DN488_c0_g1~~TRINITY_DN488_c0_g1_i1.p1  ORF type:complete len:437 (+),score=110.68 TRINITY_DN488_c0_g1_i1:126-1436(+)